MRVGFSVEKVQPETQAERTRVLQTAARELEVRGEPFWPLEALEPAALQDAYAHAETVVGVSGR